MFKTSTFDHTTRKIPLMNISSIFKLSLFTMKAKDQRGGKKSKCYPRKTASQSKVLKNRHSHVKIKLMPRSLPQTHRHTVWPNN